MKRAIIRTIAPGRSISHFQELFVAEQQLCDAARTGSKTKIGDERPEQGDAQNIVRGEFIRFLALGGDRTIPVHERGIILKGAYITGELDLEACTNVRPLQFESCWFDSRINVAYASMRAVGLDACRTKGIR